MSSFARRGLRCLLIVACVLGSLLPQTASAQPKEGGAGIASAQARTEPSWVAPYFLIALSLGLGIMVVGRPSKREDPSAKNEGPV